jgi:serine protease Do
MKNQFLLVGSSLLSAMLAVFIYRLVDKPREVIIRESIPARYTYYQDPFDGSAQRQFLSSAPTNFISAAESVTPAVVNIKTIQPKGKGSMSFELWGPGSISASTGSGVIVSPDGYIVTNNHVIEESENIEVTLNDRREYPAKIIGRDPSTDLALLKIKAENLPYLELGNSDSLRVGEWVLAVGNPFNLESTVTAGIVSAKGRSIDILEGQDRIESFIQTDAAVNPGNSGGALVNTNGELVGINTAIITRSGRYEGYSFAVPANLVRKVIKDLRDYGQVQRGLLGVFIDEMNSLRAAELGLSSIEGVYITRVAPGGGAEDAGLRKGDVIIAINGITTKTLPAMQEQVGRYRPGNTITIDYLRNGKKHTVDVVLKNKSNTTTILPARNEDVLRRLGFELRELSAEEKQRLKVEGVKVVSIYRGSRVERTNMDPGFIITKIDNRKISAINDLIRAIEKASGKVMLEGVYENYAGEYYYAFPVD